LAATPGRAQGLWHAADGVPHPSLLPPTKAKRPAKAQAPDAAPPPKSSEPPPRITYTAAEAIHAAIPGMPDARFWADSETDFKAALPVEPGPWLVLSSGGADGAFGAGLLNGLTAAGRGPGYVVVTRVSPRALMAA